MISSFKVWNWLDDNISHNNHSSWIPGPIKKGICNHFEAMATKGIEPRESWSAIRSHANWRDYARNVAAVAIGDDEVRSNEAVKIISETEPYYLAAALTLALNATERAEDQRDRLLRAIEGNGDPLHVTLSGWGAYASEYFRDKWRLENDIVSMIVIDNTAAIINQELNL
jgi:hypothetical protein